MGRSKKYDPNQHSNKGILMSIQSLSTTALPFVNTAVKEFSNAKISRQFISLLSKIFASLHTQHSLIKEDRNHTKTLLSRVTKEEVFSSRLQAASYLLNIPSALTTQPVYQVGFKIASEASNALFQGAANDKRATKEDAHNTLSELSQNLVALNAFEDRLRDALRNIQQHDGAK